MKRAIVFIGIILTAVWLMLRKIFVWIKKFIWDHRQGIQLTFTFLSLLLLVLAIWISYDTLKESQRFGSTMIAQMDTLSQLFTKVNEQISYLPKSVSGFDSTIRRLDEGISEQQQEFQKSIGGLRSNIDVFSKGISDYGKTLAKIVVASDKQLNLLKARQELLEKELMKKPVLELHVKECEKDTAGRLRIIPKIVNRGDEIATFCRILLKVPAELDFQSSGYLVWDSTSTVQAWSHHHTSWIPHGYKPMVSSPKMQFTIRIAKGLPPPYQFLCALYHDKGFDLDTLVIDPSECR